MQVLSKLSASRCEDHYWCVRIGTAASSANSEWWFDVASGQVALLLLTYLVLAAWLRGCVQHSNTPLRCDCVDGYRYILIALLHILLLVPRFLYYSSCLTRMSPLI